MSTSAKSASPLSRKDPDPHQSSRPPAGPNKRRGWVGSLQIVGVVAVVAAAVIFSREPPSAPVSAPVPGNEAAAAATSAPPVRVLLPEATRSTLTLATNGTVQVRHHIGLTPQVSGAVVSVAPSMRVGGEFQAGEVLFAIDPRDYQLALDQANAEVAAAEKRLLLQEVEGEAARKNYKLLHGDAPVPMLVGKVPQIELSKAELDSTRARAAKARLDLSRTQFSLPFAGRITQSSVGPGQLLSAGQPVGQAFALEALEVVVPVAQTELEQLNPAADRRALIRVGGREIPAIVDRVSAELDQRTRFARLFLSLTDGTILPPGTFVEVTLFGPEVADTFVLPEAVEQAGGTVWLIADGTLQSFPPKILARTDAGLIVEAFDAAQGIALGSIPGAHSGLAVTAVPTQTKRIVADSVDRTGGVSGASE